jgi:hypothetical protein
MKTRNFNSHLAEKWPLTDLTLTQPLLYFALSFFLYPLRNLGAPLMISHLPMYGKLHPTEVNFASTLRLTPVQYIRCKRTLIRAAIEYQRRGTPFRKSDAQKLCRVDVNKTSSLWSIFGELGWLGQTWPN